MKKILVLLLSGVMIFSLSGCIAKQGVVENNNIEVITMLKPKGIRGFEQIIDNYEKNHNNVNIKVVEITDSTNEIYKVYTTTLNSKDSDIDIYLMDEIWIDEFAQSGYLEPLKLKIEEENYDANAIDFFTSDDVMYALPFVLDIGVLFYRKDRISETPKSWSDVINTSPQPIFEKKEDEDILCNCIELGEYLEDAYPYFTETGNEGGDSLKTRFKKGDINYYKGWSKDYAYFNDYAFDIGGNIGVMIPDIPVLGGYGLAISSFSEKKDTAQHFLEYISDSPNIRGILKKEGYIPVQKEFLSDKMFVDYNPCMKDIENTILKAVVRKSDARYIENSWNLQKQLYMAICEKKAPPELKTIYKQQNQKGR